MKKVVLSGLAIVAVVVLVTPRIVGLQFESKVQEIVSSINQMPVYQANVNSLQSGWFSSTAEISIGMKMPDTMTEGMPPIDLSFNLLVEGAHGPVLLSDGFSLGWLFTKIQTNAKQLPEGLVAQDAAPIYMFEGITGFSGSTSYNDAVAALSYTDADTSMILEFSGMTGTGEVSAEKLVYESAASSLNIEIPSALIFNMNELTIDVDAEAGIVQFFNQELYDSVANISVASMDVNNPTNSNSSTMTNLSVDIVSDFDEASDLGDVKIATRLASVESQDMSLKDFVLDIEFKNLQGEFIKAYNKLTGDMLDLVNDPEASAQAMDNFMDEYLLSQLQAEPEYNLTAISGKIDDSEFNGMILAKIAGVSEMPVSIEDQSFWLQHAVVDSKLTMQKGAALYVASQMVKAQVAGNPQFMAMNPEEQSQLISQQAEATLVGLEQQGMISINEEDYQVVFTMQNAEAILNGNPIPL